MKISLFCSCIILYKITLNFTRLKFLEYYQKQYKLLLSKQNSRIHQCKYQTLDLFKKAGIEDSKIPITRPMGYGQIMNATTSVFLNFPSNQIEFIPKELAMFENAIGVYKSRILQSISPLYWIDLILFFPKNLLNYIGLNMESVVFKLCNIFFTALWWVICFLATLFQSEIKNFIIETFTNFK